ncbi:F26K24.10 protein [Striga asiatica]|uniref:F26K24.10 protein n=1 Tax=Striga asiatica TaxID=4170 RepID=A0A5A7QFH6_STRAF|nr:F26K24.10 protein [Striga asiatica]
MSTHSPSLRQVLSETWRVIAAHPRHFLALSALFLLPVSFSAVLYYLHSISTISTPYTQPHLLISILYILPTLFFTLCAIPSITTTTFAAFHRKPISFRLSLQSIVLSFFPLLATKFITQIIFGSILFVFGVLVLVAYIGLTLLGLEIEYDNNSPYFLVFVVMATVVLVFVFVYLQVEWCLSSAVVVLESKWGFEPLRRSSRLVKGKRWVALSMTVLFASIGSVLTVLYSNLVRSKGGVCQGWVVFVQMVVYVVVSTVLSLYGLVANTVLFAYCKELTAMIDEETSGKYVALPIV